MIYTFGCSFTKWFWPTWSDWLQEYQNTTVINLAWPGFSNETIYWELLSRKNDISSDDTIYIMLTGSNRERVWYDNEWIEKNDCRGFFPRNDGKLECSNIPWVGLYRTHPLHENSLTHLIISNFNLILQIQLILDKIGCNYHMMFWQNPWYDVRPIIKPIWKAIWHNKLSLTSKETHTSKQLLELSAMQSLLLEINWDKFIFNTNNTFDVSNPSTYDGLWEYNADILKKNKNLGKYCHKTDHHPSTLIHHNYVCDVLLSTEKNLYQKAIDLASKYKSCSVEYDYSFLMPDNITQSII